VTLALSGNWWIFLVFSIGLVLVAGPFVWMVLSSFKNAQELHAFPPTLFPSPPAPPEKNTPQPRSSSLGSR